MTIKENIRRILDELPENVRLVAAVKTRKHLEILEAVEAGITILGENYIQEAEQTFEFIGNRVEWHFIGHLQKNKDKKAVRYFDMIETLDSVVIAREIDKRCAEVDKIMPVLIEINSGREPQKSGVYPEEAENLIREISRLANIRVMGLMTMGPLTSNAEDIRSCFTETKRLFETMKSLELPRVEMTCLSMGMTDSYRIALEEGANIIRIGSKIFGERIY